MICGTLKDEARDAGNLSIFDDFAQPLAQDGRCLGRHDPELAQGRGFY